MKGSTIENIFKLSMLCTLLLSFYIYVMSISSKTHKYQFNAWQFPMLLALFIELINS